MEYKKFGTKIYLRLDRGDEVISSVIATCKKEGINSAIFSGIGGCSEVTVSTLNPDTNQFIHHSKTGMLEMVSLNGNITLDENNELSEHTHAMFTYLEDDVKSTGGHLSRAVISYTAEIVIDPVENGIIRKSLNDTLGIPLWKL